MYQGVVNPYKKKNPNFTSEVYDFIHSQDAFQFHQTLPNYKPTPLIELEDLAQKLGVNKLLVKDESYRFGVKAFKPLGASYAIYRFIKKEWEKKNPSSFLLYFLGNSFYFF